MGHSHRKPSNYQDLESSLNEVIQQVDGNIEVEEEDQSEISNKVILKEAEVQTDPSFVTVEVKEVSKFYEIFVEESLKERIDEELESFWDENGINGFYVNKEQNYFRVDISCWEFSESFTASSAASLLQSLSWPKGVSVIFTKPTSYKEKNS